MTAKISSNFFRTSLSFLVVVWLLAGAAKIKAENKPVEFGGIGAMLSTNATPYTVIAEVLPDGAASTARLKAGDLITAVDSVSTEGKTLGEVISLLRGEVGSFVKISYIRDGEPVKQVSLLRQLVKIQAPINSTASTVMLTPKANKSNSNMGEVADVVSKQFTKEFLDTKKEMDDLRAKAEMGDLTSQYKYANRLYFGDSQFIQKNYQEAARWYRKAAEQGLADAQFNLANHYLDGEGVERDLFEAMRWYRKAADQGIAEAQYNLGIAYKAGQGVKRDLVEAVLWYRKAANQGFAVAQCNLGFCYENGQGVEQDLVEAVQWYRKAANQGFAEAQYNLSICYKKGKGVERDSSEAVRWLIKYADQVDAKEQCDIGEHFAEGDGVGKNLQEAAHLYLKSAEKGWPKAYLKLGLAYYSGLGVEKSMEKSWAYFKLAADANDALAQANLQMLESRITSDQIEGGKRLLESLRAKK